MTKKWQLYNTTTSEIKSKAKKLTIMKMLKKYMVIRNTIFIILNNRSSSSTIAVPINIRAAWDQHLISAFNSNTGNWISKMATFRTPQLTVVRHTRELHELMLPEQVKIMVAASHIVMHLPWRLLQEMSEAQSRPEAKKKKQEKRHSVKSLIIDYFIIYYSLKIYNTYFLLFNFK